MAARALESAPAAATKGARAANVGATAAGPALQAKLTVGPTRDRFEAEADRVAARVASPRFEHGGPPPAISSLPPAHVASRAPAGRAPEEAEETPRLVAQSKRAGAGRSTEEPEVPIEELVTQRTSTGHGGGSFGAPPAVESAISRMRARPAGRLDARTRSSMERGLGHDLGGVRLHRGAAAADAARSIGAKAFTVGSDVFFGAGQYRPHTTSGRALIAHELTHTVQQAGPSGRVQRARIQRAKDATTSSQIEPDKDAKETKEAPPDEFEHPQKGKVDLKKKEITLPVLELPSLLKSMKGTAGGETQPKATTETLPEPGKEYRLSNVPDRRASESKAYEVWTEHAKTWASDIETALGEHLAGKESADLQNPQGDKLYFLRRGGEKRPSSLLIGSVSEIARSEAALRPQWSQAGADARLDADHILEWQLGGADSAENMFLLSSSYNRSVGPAIAARIRKSVRELLAAANADKDFRANPAVPPPDGSGVTQATWTFVFRDVKPGKGFATAPRGHYWTKAQVAKAKHLEITRPLTEGELAAMGLQLDPTKIPTKFLVFPTATGGKHAEFTVRKDKSVTPPKFFFWGLELAGPPVYEQGDTLESRTLTLKMRRFKRKKGTKELIRSDNVIEEPVSFDTAMKLGGVIDPAKVRLRGLFQGAEFTKMSPIDFSDVGLDADGVLVGHGEIIATAFLFPGLRVPISIVGSDILISFPVPTDRLNFGPLTVTEAALGLGVGEKGFFVEGYADLLVASVGSGRVSARAEKDDVVVSGAFGLDMDFLEPAEVAIAYSFARDELSGSAKLGVRAGALPGVESGQLHVVFGNDALGVTGTLGLGGALAGSEVTVGYTPETGLVIAAADLPLPVDRIPGVTNAKLSVAAARDPQSGTWLVSGAGKADIETSAATGTIDVAYRGGAILIRGQGTVAAGPATGTIDVTVTNMPLDEQGRPVEGEVTDEFTAWGRGSASMTFGEILTGTAGLEFTPDGRVIISGEIALPNRFEVFDKQDYGRELLALSSPEFPIWGLSIAGIGFGVFASADGYVNLVAWVGPGTIENARIGAEMDLERPEDAVVTGGARFVVPAYAGLELGVGGNLTARAAVAFVRGRVGITGELGLGVQGGLDIDVAWSRATGLELDASAAVEARPKFSVGIEASVRAGVDLKIKEVAKTFGPWKKPLGEFGPDMTLKVTMPGRWTERDGLDLSVDDIVVQRPSLDARSILDGAFDRLVG